MSKYEKLTGYPSIDKPWLKYYSEDAINVKLPECTIYEYLYKCNKDYQDRTALNYVGVKISFEKLFSNIEKTKNAFSAIGVKNGDIVVMSTVTIPETVYSLYALNILGAIPNMIDPRTSVEGIKEYIEEVNAKYVITLSVAYPKIKEATKDIPIEKIVIMSPSDSLTTFKKFFYNISSKFKGENYIYASNCLEWDDFISKGIDTKAAPEVYEKDKCCVIVHTGGTTGLPKGVMLTNENINALVFQSILTGIDMKREHTWMDIMPPFIAYGVGMGLHLPLVIGMETILIPSFDASKFDELLLKHKPVHMVGVPSYWGTILNSKKLKNKDMSYIIAPTVGGDSMDIELEKRANAYLEEHGCSSRIVKGYGMTEVCAGVTGTVEQNNEVGSVGIPFVKSVVSIFNLDSGEEMKYGEIGEVCITGPNVMLGYYNKKEETENIIKTHKDGSKWVHSGDLGYMNENGSLFIVDRIKRVIIRYDGFKVFPSLIEKTIISHDAVCSCCVIGKPDEKHSQGRLPVAFIVLAEINDSEEKIQNELVELCKQELPEYAQPVVYKFCDKLPLTGIGKIDYRALENML